MVKPIVGVTLGDPAGIGPEICAKALTHPEIQSIARCIIIGDRKIVRNGLKTSKISGIEINAVNDIKNARFTKNTIDVFDLDNVEPSKLITGKVQAIAGKAAYQYLAKAIELAQNKLIDAIATAPINKEAVNKAGIKFPGHTEILAKKTKTKNYAMLFAADYFWVALVTTHIPLNKVSQQLNKKRIINVIKLTHQTLSKIRKKPKIGVAGLNPHAGEGGIFGKEDAKIIKPAVEAAKKLGIDIKGPLSPDAIFYLAKAGMFDVIVAMYHDQGLIPLKLLSFNHSVNITIGLPIIRTSVDHGTGFDIAGKGWANPQSLIEAIKVATHLAKAR